MKLKLKEVGIFPNPCEMGHAFTPYNDTHEPDRAKGYYKSKNGKADTSKVYAMLYCSKCGATKEITIINRLRG